jgi:hypothetical protein
MKRRFPVRVWLTTSERAYFERIKTLHSCGLGRAIGIAAGLELEPTGTDAPKQPAPRLPKAPTITDAVARVQAAEIRERLLRMKIEAEERAERRREEAKVQRALEKVEAAERHERHLRMRTLSKPRQARG